MFNFIKEKIKKVYTSFTSKAASLFERQTVDEAFLKELEVLLIEADVGIKTTQEIMQELREQLKADRISSGTDIKNSLQTMLLERLSKVPHANATPRVLLMVGINGSGKTTFCGKLANHLAQHGKKVLLVAGDTFRAAATEQLQEWGARAHVTVLAGKENQDPSSLIFDACDTFARDGYDHIIIDTAGRLQTKVNLMRELEKIHRIIGKKLPEETISTFLAIDAMLGQNSFEQAKLFHGATALNGLVLTKMDGTGKGGIVFAITKELGVPIVYVTCGESINDIAPFDAAQYVSDLLNK